MIYPIPATLTNGLIEVLPRHWLSDGDKDIIGVLYPFRPTRSPLLVVGQTRAISFYGISKERWFRLKAEQSAHFALCVIGLHAPTMTIFGPDAPDHFLQEVLPNRGRTVLQANLTPGDYYLRLLLPSPSSDAHALCVRLAR
jgi:hypothetical protein